MADFLVGLENVGLENERKKLIPTSSEARSGNPLGSKIALQNNVVPIGYVKCDGQQFDSTQYPALYAYLGTDVAPCEFDKSRLGDYENAIQGVQEYDGFITFVSNTYGSQVDAYVYINDVAMFHCVAQYATSDITIPFKKGDKVTWTANVWQPPKARFYKHYLCIKATSGLEETQQDYVLQSLLEADSYSTEEVATGKKWIDGKMIYRKVIHAQSITFPYSVASLNIDFLVDMRAIGNNNSGHNNWISANFGTQGDIYLTNDKANIAINTFDANIVFTDIILEYTKAD